MIIKVRHNELAVSSDCDSAWSVKERARLRAARTERPDGLAIRREHLDSVVDVLGHIQIAVWPEDCVHRTVEVSQLFAHLSPGGHERAIGTEPLDSIVARIRDVDVTVWADSHTNRCAKLPWRCPAAAPGAHQDVTQITTREEQGPGVPGRQEQ